MGQIVTFFSGENLTHKTRSVELECVCDRWKSRVSPCSRTLLAWRRSPTATQRLNCWSSLSVTSTYRRSAATTRRSR